LGVVEEIDSLEVAEDIDSLGVELLYAVRLDFVDTEEVVEDWWLVYSNPDYYKTAVCLNLGYYMMVVYSNPDYLLVVYLGLDYMVVDKDFDLDIVHMVEVDLDFDYNLAVG
jgi:hypothetical protein